MQIAIFERAKRKVPNLWRARLALLKLLIINSLREGELVGMGLATVDGTMKLNATDLINLPVVDASEEKLGKIDDAL